MESLPYLKKGDKIAIVAPAKSVEKVFIDFAVKFWKNQGFVPVLGQNIFNQSHYFAGSVSERANDFNAALMDPEIKAVICARGGYGCVQLIDLINWGALINQPKWIVGFSDVTVFHQKLAHLGIPSIHATMPLNYSENTPESLNSLVNDLTGIKNDFVWNSNALNVRGRESAELIGGNLAVLCSLIGTEFMPSFKGKILFVEEVGEHIYAIDRMFYQLNKAGVLSQIRALIVGSFSSVKDTEVPYGLPWQEVILKHFKYSNIPVCFDFPAGHQEDNRSLVFGGNYELNVETTQSSLIKL